MRSFLLLHLSIGIIWLIPLEVLGASSYVLTTQGLIENPQAQKQQEYNVESGSSFGNQNFFPKVWRLTPTFDISRSIRPILQKYKLSCEIAATQIALENLNYATTEDDLIQRLPIWDMPYDTGSGIWGDPDREFVGSITGSQRKQTGYGIYEKPLSDMIHTFGFTTSIVNSTLSGTGFDEKKELTKLLTELESGSRIILWGDWCTSERYEDGRFSLGEKWLKYIPISGKNTCNRDEILRVMNWKTAGGKNIRAISGEHAFVLLGYIGSREEPSHIIVWDTDTGRHIYPIHEWMRKWSLLNHRSLIIRK